jgi:hypothetical protein
MIRRPEVTDHVFNHHLQLHQQTIATAINEATATWSIRNRYDNELVSAALDIFWTLVPWLDGDSPPDDPSAAVYRCVERRLQDVAASLATADRLRELEHDPAASEAFDPVESTEACAIIEATIALTATDRQREIARRRMAGQTLREIAHAVGVSPATVIDEIVAVYRLLPTELQWMVPRPMKAIETFRTESSRIR